MPVGDSRSIEGLGELLETIYLTEPPSVVIEGATLTAAAGGISCLRFRYREVAGENAVQTLCVVSFDETGDCEGLDPMTLDLQRFLAPTQEPVGNANLLEYGEGLFYAACRTETGAYRLQQPDRPLPPLHFTIVDALCEGPYCLGDAEMESQRAGTVITFSGREIRPPWIVSVSREINWLRLAEDGSVQFNDEDCSRAPSCTFSAEVVQPGDILRISFGIPVELFRAALDDASEAVKSRFFRDRIGMEWREIDSVHPDAVGVAFARLAALDVMGELLPYFDDLYALRQKGIAIGYFPFWYAQQRVEPLCFPDEQEQERCQQIEQAIQRVEAERISGWRAAGYDLWYASFIDYHEGGEYVPFSELRPHYTNFAGILGGIGANSSVRVPDVPETLAQVVRQFALEIGPETPVILSLNGPPITAQTVGPFCEAEICPSDFRGMYEQAEAALDAALQSLKAGQLRGFGVALFEGAHFDIRQPYESFPGFSLNRVGETGYNNPVLNIYRAQ